MFIAPEDIIVAKLVAHRETGSDKHLLDAQVVLVIQWGGLDLDLVRRRARAAGVMERFETVASPDAQLERLFFDIPDTPSHPTSAWLQTTLVRSSPQVSGGIPLSRAASNP